MKISISPQKKVVLSTMGMILVVAFWLSPELGLLALGGIVLMSVFYSISWFLLTQKKG